MRLIDADKLIENINEIYKGYMTDESGCVPYDFERIVDEQPTAYDIDKELRLNTIKEVLKIADCSHTDCWDCAFADADLCKLQMLYKDWNS